MDLFVDVAVALPLSNALTYLVPQTLHPLAVPGVRVRVRVGKRRVLGVIVGRSELPPEGITTRPLEEIIDREPVLSPELLQLAAVTADYYLAPLGEVIRSMLPSALPPWGDRRIWLTDAGALSIPKGQAEQTVLDLLREKGKMRLAEIQVEVGTAILDKALEPLEREGKVALSSGERRGSRYATAVELAPGELEDLLMQCGRSVPGREVVRYLAALSRPATVSEVLGGVGCSRGVVRRLVDLGVVRQFTQLARLPLEHHLFSPEESHTIVQLRPDQERAVVALVESTGQGEYAAFLLTGVTGTGKTEVYLRAVETALERGCSAIVLVPEIALVPALAGALREKFGKRTAILHSALSGGERHQEWERIRAGEARVVLGPRSAIFAPVSDLGLVVVDEEQDGSYKQDSVPRYNARDLALLRAQREKAVAVVVSATPSLETRHNVEIGKVGKLVLTERVGHGQVPEGILVDLRQEGSPRRAREIHFSARLTAELEQTLAAGDQAVLLRNRRGYAPLLLCRACGADMRCNDCGLPRTYHRRDGVMRCHYCGSTLRVPASCPTCGEEALEPIGAGTERVEETFRELFPNVSVDTLDRDTLRRRGGLTAVLERFARRETSVLIGTQMIAKGHHFPRVALSGVLLADTYLGFPDFRAVERTYGLLTQLAGRAGRGDRPGKVVIQTYHPEHYAIQAALRHDDAAFEDEEMRFRRIFHYPPYTRMVQLLIRDTNRSRAETKINELTRQLESHPLARGIRISGPAPAPFEKLRGKWRFQLLLRGTSGARLRELVRALGPEHAGELLIDVDPYELL